MWSQKFEKSVKFQLKIRKILQKWVKFWICPWDLAKNHSKTAKISGFYVIFSKNAKKSQERQERQKNLKERQERQERQKSAMLAPVNSDEKKVKLNWNFAENPEILTKISQITPEIWRFDWKSE